MALPKSVEDAATAIFRKLDHGEGYIQARVRAWFLWILCLVGLYGLYGRLQACRFVGLFVCLFVLIRKCHGWPLEGKLLNDERWTETPEGEGIYNLRDNSKGKKQRMLQN